MKTVNPISHAQKLGVAIFRSPIDYEAHAPRGFVFKNNLMHIVSEDKFGDLAERIEEGIKPCEEAKCSICECGNRFESAAEYAEQFDWDLILDSKNF